MTAARQQLVLVPGLLCDEAVFAGQLPALARVAEVQVAEHGLIDSLGAMAAKILAETHGRFWIAGHSMGGRVALEVARRASDRVRGLALLNTGCKALPTGEAGERERATRMTFLQQAELEGMGAMSERWLQNMIAPDRRNDAPLTRAIVAMQARRTSAHLAAQTRALLQRPDASGVLAVARCPVLVLAAEHDLNSPPAANREMAGLAANNQLVILPGCGHMAPMEQPAAVAEALLSWLALTSIH